MLPHDSVTLQLIRKLEYGIEDVVDSQTPLVQESLANFEGIFFAYETRFLKAMRKQNTKWQFSLDDLKQQAEEKKVNVESCLGEKETELLLQFQINYDDMKNCSAKLIHANEESADKFYKLVSLYSFIRS